MVGNIKWIWIEFKRNYKSKKRRKDRLKENTRTNQSTNKQEENVYLNPPASSSRAYLLYEYNKKKYHCLLNICKHETGIKISFDLWKL